MIIKQKKIFISAVAAIVLVDLGIQDLVFGETKTMTTDLIEYDSATIEGVSPEYNSFANTANVQRKDGKDTTTLAPVNFNDSIAKGVIDANATKFGENEYGDTAGLSAEVQSALDGVGKLHLNAMVGRKKIMYEALALHKIVGGYITETGREDIVFNVPSDNMEIFDGTTKLYWSNAASKPLTDMKRAISNMKIKPRFAVMNESMYTNFVNNAQVITEANSTDTAKNFTLNENIDIEKDLFLAGRVMFEGIVLDVYVERGTRFTGSAYVPYMPDGYVSYAGRNGGATYFGGIPVAVKDGVRNISAEFDVDEVIKTDPPQHKVVYRTAPLPVLKNGESFYSQKVEA